jgi:hypothetical protein
MCLCVLNQEGEILLHQHMKAGPEPFLKALAPYREDRVVCVECLFTWDLTGCPLRPRGYSLRPGPRALSEGHPRGQGPTRYHRRAEDGGVAPRRHAPPRPTSILLTGAPRGTSCGAGGLGCARARSGWPLSNRRIASRTDPTSASSSPTRRTGTVWPNAFLIRPSSSGWRWTSRCSTTTTAGSATESGPSSPRPSHTMPLPSTCGAPSPGAARSCAWCGGMKALTSAASRGFKLASHLAASCSAPRRRPERGTAPRARSSVTPLSCGPALKRRGCSSATIPPAKRPSPPGRKRPGRAQPSPCWPRS